MVAALLASPKDAELPRVLACVFTLNLAGSVLDVAVDGWAVDILRTEELAAGNAAQVEY